MKLLVGSLALGVLLLGSGGAEAGLFRKYKLPKPVDTPILRPKLGDGHKVHKALHPSKYQKPYLGVLKVQARPLPHYQVE